VKTKDSVVSSATWCSEAGSIYFSFGSTIKGVQDMKLDVEFKFTTFGYAWTRITLSPIQSLSDSIGYV